MADQVKAVFPAGFLRFNGDSKSYNSFQFRVGQAVQLATERYGEVKAGCPHKICGICNARTHWTDEALAAYRWRAHVDGIPSPHEILFGQDVKLMREEREGSSNHEELGPNNKWHDGVIVGRRGIEERGQMEANMASDLLLSQVHRNGVSQLRFQSHQRLNQQEACPELPEIDINALDQFVN